MEATEEVIESGPGAVTALAIVRRLTPMQLFAPGALDPILENIKAQVRAIKTDISTEAGRKAIGSLALKVARTKTFIDDQRVVLVGDQKKRLAAIDAEGRRMRDELDELKEEVLAPLTAWKNAQLRRAQNYETLIQVMLDICGHVFVSIADVDRAGVLVDETWADHDFEEFTERAARAHEQALLHLKAERDILIKAEADRIEKERLRLEAEGKERLAREAKIAEEARLKAETEAQRRRDADAELVKQREADLLRTAAEEKARLEKHIEEEKARAERIRLAAEERDRQVERDRLQAEEDLRARDKRRDLEVAAHLEACDKLAAEKAERDRIAAAAEADRQRVLAVEAERKRVADEEAAKENERKLKLAEDEKRAKDKQHRAAIHAEILADIGMALHGNSDGDSVVLRGVITAIAKGQIRHVAITY